MIGVRCTVEFLALVLSALMSGEEVTEPVVLNPQPIAYEVERSVDTCEVNSFGLVKESWKMQEGTILWADEEIKIYNGVTTDSEVVDVFVAGDSFTLLRDLGFGWFEVSWNKGRKTGFIESGLACLEPPVLTVSSTAYYNQYNRSSASGRELVQGKTIAGRVAWCGRWVNIYKVNDDGSRGDYIGKFQFDDTGYGQATGEGESKILKNKTIGTIENGTCIDFYMDEYDDCIQYGRRDVIIEFITE